MVTQASRWGTIRGASGHKSNGPGVYPAATHHFDPAHDLKEGDTRHGD